MTSLIKKIKVNLDIPKIIEGMCQGIDIQIPDDCIDKATAKIVLSIAFDVWEAVIKRLIDASDEDFILPCLIVNTPLHKLHDILAEHPKMLLN